MTPDQLLLLADQCVKCGLCLPHCPTYRELADEAESPRGRIALIQGWASGQLDLTPRLSGHLDRCLQCRACEGACPSLVAYGRLADGARAARVRTLNPWRRGWRRIRLGLLSNPRLTPWLVHGAQLYASSGLARLMQWSGLADIAGLAPYHRLARVLPLNASRVEPSIPDQPDLELFAGCMGGPAQGHAIAAARRLCEDLGLRVLVPTRSRCCGALLRHQGFPPEADRRLGACTRPAGAPPLVGLASACVAELREETGSGIQELCTYLASLPVLDRIPLRPLKALVLVHEPCSHRNLLRDTASVYRLLGRIPGLEVRPLAGNSSCCGAAGSYLLEQPTMAQALLAPKLGDLAVQRPDFVVTTNPGCALHLQAGIREAGLQVRVCHPVELIWESAEVRT